MLGEDEPPTGPQHATDLAERRGQVPNRTEDERTDDGVDTGVVELELLGSAREDLGPQTESCGFGAGLVTRDLAGLDAKPADVWVIVLEIAAGTRAQLEHRAA